MRVTPPESSTESSTESSAAQGTGALAETPTVRISQLAEHVGKQVTLQGWLYNKTGKGKLQFLQIRDGSGICQAVLFRGNVSDELFEAAKELTQESSLSVRGEVKADPRAPGIP